MEKKMESEMETGEYGDLWNLISVTILGKPYNLLHIPIYSLR